MNSCVHAKSSHSQTPQPDALPEQGQVCREDPGMDAIPVTEGEQTTPDQEFGLRVLTPDTGHPAAYVGGNNVSH